MSLSVDEYRAGDFWIDVHIVTADESPLEIDTTGGYVRASEGTVLVPSDRGRYDILPQPWFSETFTHVVRNDDGTFKSEPAPDTDPDAPDLVNEGGATDSQGPDEGGVTDVQL